LRPERLFIAEGYPKCASLFGDFAGTGAGLGGLSAHNLIPLQFEVKGVFFMERPRSCTDFTNTFTPARRGERFGKTVKRLVFHPDQRGAAALLGPVGNLGGVPATTRPGGLHLQGAWGKGGGFGFRKELLETCGVISHPAFIELISLWGSRCTQSQVKEGLITGGGSHPMIAPSVIPDEAQ